MGVDTDARNVDTLHVMPTDKTRSVSTRVPVIVADALVADATETGMTPGALLRRLLEKRYERVSPGAGKIATDAEKPCNGEMVGDLE